MSRAQPATKRAVDDDTRQKLKRHARRLFGERGIENVTVRDILSAAGQRHVGAIGYYFGSKDALVREILAEGALLIDTRRIAFLDQLEAGGVEISVRDLVQVILRSFVGLENGGETYARFFATFRQHDQALFMEVISNGLDRGFRRCVVHLRHLLQDCPHEILNQRIRFMMLLLSAAMSMRELAIEHAGTGSLNDIFGGGSWTSPTLLDNLVDACEGIFLQPVSPEAAAART